MKTKLRCPNIDLLMRVPTIFLIFASWFVVPAEALSQAQSKCISTYGYPPQFIQLFAKQQGNTRIIESWAYPERGFQILFDNGFFSQRIQLSPTKQLTATRLKPTQFGPFVTRAYIDQSLGTPEHVNDATCGKKKILVYRYNKPEYACSLVFINNHLLGVSAGNIMPVKE